MMRLPRIVKTVLTVALVISIFLVYYIAGAWPGSVLSQATITHFSSNSPPDIDFQTYADLKVWINASLHYQTETASIDTLHLPNALRQTYVESEGFGNVLFLVQSSAARFWKQMPVQVYTTLARLPKFLLYSDAPGVLAGRPVIDAVSLLPPLPQVTRSKEYRNHEFHLKFSESNAGIVPESLAFGPGSGSVELEALAVLPILVDAYEREPNMDWYVFMKDQTYFFLDTLRMHLRNLNCTHQIVLGSKGGDVQFGPPGNVTFLTFPSFDGGYIVSAGAMQALLGPKEDRKTVVEKYTALAVEINNTAAAVGLAFSKTGTELAPGDAHPLSAHRFTASTIETLRFGLSRWCIPLTSLGNLSPSEIETLWEFEQLQEDASEITYQKVYHSFLLPFIVDKRVGWEFDAYSMQWSSSTNEAPVVFPEEPYPLIFPNSSVTACQETCRILNRCLSWTYSQNVCGIVTSYFMLGKFANPYVAHAVPGDTPISGWMTDKIRASRANQFCDPLTFSDEVGVFSDDMGAEEGWYLQSHPELIDITISVPGRNFS